MSIGSAGVRVPLYQVHMPPEVDPALSEVLHSGRIANGPNVERFEDLLREYIGNPYLITTGDVSSSLALCLYLAGVRPGDEVIASPMACLATNAPICNLFARVKWCDVDPLTGNMNPDDLACKVTPSTKAILVYHWAGNPADLDTIYALARNHGVPVIEDAGEALGAEFRGRKIGNTGADYTVFSFYPNRQLTTGEGAAITFARAEDWERGRWLKRYGIHQPTFRRVDGEINPDSDIPEVGWNTYLSNLAATIGLSQMPYLPWVVARHQANGDYYDRALAGIPGVTLLERPPGAVSVHWVYTFLADRPEDLLQKLRRHGVWASKVHLRNDLYTGFESSGGDLPGVDHFQQHCLSVPCGWWVDEAAREHVASAIREAGD